jgi:protein-disulfide isomerase
MSRLIRAVDALDWAKGPADAPVTLVEYGDFECPHCAKAWVELQQLERLLEDDLRFVFRHFPLSQLHPHAMLAAEAAEAAGAQGAFWAMHDALFSNQRELEAPALLRYAGQLGLDLVGFGNDLQAHRFRGKVRRDFLEGVRSGVNGTPTLFINGRRYDGRRTAESLLTAIERRPTFTEESMTGRDL